MIICANVPHEPSPKKIAHTTHNENSIIRGIFSRDDFVVSKTRWYIERVLFKGQIRVDVAVLADITC
jgi:hypothetical protein